MPLRELAALVDTVRLTAWLDAHVPELGDGPLEVAWMHGGTSNVIVSLQRGAHAMILRRPPSVPPPKSERTVLREARVLTALNGTAVPHPHCYGSCDDSSVIGAPFYVMELVDGWPAELRDGRIYHQAPFDRAPYEYGIAYAVVEGLIALANVDYRAIGLADFGRPEGFLDRQVDRWAAQLASYDDLYQYPGRHLPGYDVAAQWLRANVPSDDVTGIIHGDVGTPNMLFAHDRPARLRALIDWELSTIGDPLIDLAWFCKGLRDERDPGTVPSTALYDAANLPTRQELARYYAAGTGRDVSNFDYYLALAMFKSGCILEYKVAQAAVGVLPKETGDFFSRLVLANFADAATLIARLD
jgi:aminoglycoside phosphotransferase (APT) family kinase protein